MQTISFPTYKKINSGYHFFSSVDLDKFSGEDDLISHMKSVHKDEVSPELFFECDSDVYSDFVSENSINWTGIEQVRRLLENYPLESIKAFIAINGVSQIERMDSVYEGEYSSQMEFATQYGESINLFDGVNTAVIMYFDWDAYARDIFINTFRYHNGHVFRILN